VVIDLFSRKVVGWSLGRRLTSALVCEALQMALWNRQPPKGQLIFHSDRGVQYASNAFGKLLKAHGIAGSMSRKGDCWDNAVVESFFGSLKSERVHWRSYRPARRPGRTSSSTSRWFTTADGCIPTWPIRVQMSSREMAVWPMRLNGVSVFT
jgi:transposase InsO family protein